MNAITNIAIRGTRISWNYDGIECLIISNAGLNEIQVLDWLESLTPAEMAEHYNEPAPLRSVDNSYSGDVNLVFGGHLS